jgi:hypothetical protein
VKLNPRLGDFPKTLPALAKRTVGCSISKENKAFVDIMVAAGGIYLHM